MDLDKHKNPDGTYNGVSALSEFSGLSEKSIQDIMAEVKANQAKLNGCLYHEFELHEQGALVSRSKFRCIHCGGIITGEKYHWHELGRRPKP